MTERLHTPEPTRLLAPSARAYWTVEALGWAAPVVFGGLIAGGSVDGTAGTAILVAAVLIAMVGVLALPQLRWRRWRYEVREDEIDLRRGALTITRTLVPMSRVQHVDTRRTVVSQVFGLASVVFHTAAGANAIPALTEADAAEIRDLIAGLARAPDEL